ncbi:MAG: SMI1/KNR4 family protein [Saezia sp.]
MEACLEKTALPPLQRDWEPNRFSISSIYGVDPEKANSLCGSRGNNFWINRWNYPAIGLAICDCPSCGHDMIFLDYSDCGPTGEPCVVHINQEHNYEVTYLADSFAAFVRGLLPEEMYEDYDE